MRSTASTSHRHAAHAEQGFDFGDNNFRRHCHASADMRAGVYPVAVGDGSLNFLSQPPGHVEFRDDNVLGVFCGFTDFFAGPRPQGLDLYQTATDTFVIEEPDGLTTLRHRCPRGDNEDLGIGIFCLDQPVYPFDRVFAGSLHCRPDFLLPGGMGSIADVVAFHDKWITHHPDWRTFHVHTGYGRAVWIIGWKTHVGWGEIDDVLGVRDEESVAAQCQREVHIRLFRNHVSFENPIEEVLCGFRMPDEHTGIQKI